ncbi:hypothetical protein HMPREF9443_00511 [Phascolarctobacterium succinatutens YIT 12067]|uniref:Uncharacterized protein n=1 Tax=Phascolarctobacterium succinatutens YIT 12067 TaxID=626939 RepID=E8LCE2_9FIRM|nr:hypothetical protein HMPREF9443_00511 [Phascolarctobacterium succinatutens YIT 12067]
MCWQLLRKNKKFACFKLTDQERSVHTECEYVRFFIGVKGNEENRRNYQLQEKKERNVCEN